MRLVFAGTPPAAVPSLQRLVGSAHDVAAAITRKDAEVGRKRVVTPSAVALAAESLGVPSIKANRLDAAATTEIAALEPDLGIIVAYGGLVREPLLSTPRHGWINLHFSLLPKWRGAAPVQRAIIAGDRETGACVFQLVADLDAGDVFDVQSRPIGPDETAGAVLEALSISGASLLIQVVDALQNGTATATPQRGEVSLAPKLTLDDARLDLTEPLDTVYDRFRGVTPEPGAFVLVDDARFKILAARPARDVAAIATGVCAEVDGRIVVGTADHPLELLQVQPAGKRAMSAGDWWRGFSNRRGSNRQGPVLR